MIAKLAQFIRVYAKCHNVTLTDQQVNDIITAAVMAMREARSAAMVGTPWQTPQG